MKRSLVWSLLQFVALSAPLVAADDSLIIDTYRVVSIRRVSRTEFEFEIRATLNNNGPAVHSATATVVSAAATTVILDNALSFGDVAANEKKLSSDTFKIRQNRLAAFKANVLEWTISTEAAEFTVAITDPANGLLTNGQNV